MPILVEPNDKSLKTLVQAYNLIPHDRIDERKEALEKILKEKTQDTTWLEHHLKPQLDEYHIKSISPSQTYKAHLKEQISKTEEKLDKNCKP